MFSRRKPSISLLDELQQAYNDVSDTTLKNLALEENSQLAEALRGWKSLHTSLLYKIDIFERRNSRFSAEEAAILADLKAIRDENVKHLVRIQLRLDEQTRRAKKLADQPLSAPGTNPHKMSIPSLRSSNPTSRSFNGSSQRPMVKSLRSTGGYQLPTQQLDAVKAAANLSWAKPKSVAKRYDDDIFEDFDQNELPSAHYDRFGKATNGTATTANPISANTIAANAGSAGPSAASVAASSDPFASSDSSSSVNLIDLDDRPVAAIHGSMEDLSVKPKKVPPPVPPKRISRPQETHTPSPPTRSSLAAKLQVKSSPDIRETAKAVETPKSESPKYTYTQPKPLNTQRLMQKSATKAAAKKRATATAAAKPPVPKAVSAESVPVRPAVGQPPKQAKKSNITYNYKPLEKPKTAKPKPKIKVDVPKPDSAPDAAKSPYMNDILDDYDEPEIDPATARDLEAAEQVALVKSIKGIDEVAALQILNDIVVRGDQVYWDDIVGLESAKNSLKEAVVYPFLRPDLFRGLREPTRGMLLFGPPGTGKTMLARAVATESKSTFFSISSSSLTSKYMGESEKLVKALFLLARKLSPSIVFIDEIDSLLGTRNDNEAESMRRIKNEFLVQWSELSSAAAGRDSTDGDVSRVLILGATNIPWGIDEAARRRFAKRVYIPLPEDETRQLQIRKLLQYQKNTLSEADYEKLNELTRGFSGSDITLLAKDSAMGPLRSLGDKLLSTPTEEIRPIQLEDFIESLKYIRPSVSSEGLGEYESWAAKFGSSGA